MEMNTYSQLVHIKHRIDAFFLGVKTTDEIRKEEFKLVDTISVTETTSFLEDTNAYLDSVIKDLQTTGFLVTEIDQLFGSVDIALMRKHMDDSG